MSIPRDHWQKVKADAVKARHDEALHVARTRGLTNEQADTLAKGEDAKPMLVGFSGRYHVHFVADDATASRQVLDADRDIDTRTEDDNLLVDCRDWNRAVEMLQAAGNVVVLASPPGSPTLPA